MLSVVILNVVLLCAKAPDRGVYGECRYFECRSAVCQGAQQRGVC